MLRLRPQHDNWPELRYDVDYGASDFKPPSPVFGGLMKRGGALASIGGVSGACCATGSVGREGAEYVIVASPRGVAVQPWWRSCPDYRHHG